VRLPFPALVNLPDYLKECLPRIEDFDGFVNEINHDQPVSFWREVITYAHHRGMKFYFFNWNIHLEHASDQYSSLTEVTKSKTTIDTSTKTCRTIKLIYRNQGQRLG